MMRREWVRVSRFRWVRVTVLEAYGGGWLITVRRRLSPDDAAELRRRFGSRD